jgi:hypothetical protein
MPFDYLMSWLPFTQVDRTIFPTEPCYFLAEYDKTLRYRFVHVKKPTTNLVDLCYIRFEPLFDTLRGSSRDLYFTPAQRSRLVYDCLLRTPFDLTSDNEMDEQRSKLNIFSNSNIVDHIYYCHLFIV